MNENDPKELLQHVQETRTLLISALYRLTLVEERLGRGKPSDTHKAAGFVPLVPEIPEHDMVTGPCKCGAWHGPGGRDSAKEDPDDGHCPKCGNNQPECTCDPRWGVTGPGLTNGGLGVTCNYCGKPAHLCSCLTNALGPCPVCGKERVMTSSGVVCINGHGGA